MGVIKYYVHEAKPGLVLGWFKHTDRGVERRIHGLWATDASEGSPSLATYEAQIASGKLRECVVPPALVQASTTLVPHAAIEQGVADGLRDAFAWRKHLSGATFARVSLVSSKTPDGATYYAVEASRWFGEASRVQHNVGVTTFGVLAQATAAYDKAVREHAAALSGALSINHGAASLASEPALHRSFDLGAAAEVCAKHAEKEVEKREREEREAREAERERLRKERAEEEARVRAALERAERERVAREKAEAERALRIARGDASELTDEELRMKIRAARRKAS